MRKARGWMGGLGVAAWVVAGMQSMPAAALDQPCPYGEAGTSQEAVILLYHRFGEDDVPSTNIRLAQFAEHLRLLREGGYRVLDLEQMIRAWIAGCPLPARSVAITVDDGYRSFARHGWPMLKAAGFPVTVFISTDAADQGGRRMMTWQEIRELVREGVKIGHHGAAHLHMIEAGTAAARADILRASARFRAKLGFVPKLFAYPYGEYDPELAAVVRGQGFLAALAQFSSVLGPGERRYWLPRFALNEHYGAPERVRLVLSAHAFPVAGVTPEDPVVAPRSNPPQLRVLFSRPLPGLARLGCYASHEGAIAVTVLEGGRGFSARPHLPMPPGRQRINCTLPHPGGGWYWFGRFFYVPGGRLD